MWCHQLLQSLMLGLCFVTSHSCFFPIIRFIIHSSSSFSKKSYIGRLKFFQHHLPLMVSHSSSILSPSTTYLQASATALPSTFRSYEVHSTSSPKGISNCKVKRHVSYNYFKKKKITHKCSGIYKKVKQSTLHFITPCLSHQFATFMILQPLV